MVSFNLNQIALDGIPAERARLDALTHWLGQTVSERPLSLSVASADASFRRYYRLTTPTRTYVVMDAPPENEDTRPFHTLATRLHQADVRVPEVFGWHQRQGFMLLEDLGHTTMHAWLAPFEDEQRLNPEQRLAYRQVLRQLVHLQCEVTPAQLPDYDAPFLRQEMELFRRWLLHRHLDISWSTSDERNWEALMAQLVTDTLAQPKVFVHRDYHSRNLMVNRARFGQDDELAGIIDFQDAMHGPLLYDVVSVLKDCYVCLNAEDRRVLFDDYLVSAQRAGLPVASRDPERLFDAMGMQRHLKAAGIFARLHHRDGKPGYLADIPRTLSYLVEAAERYAPYHWCADFVRHRVLTRLSALSEAS